MFFRITFMYYNYNIYKKYIIEHKAMNSSWLSRYTLSVCPPIRKIDQTVLYYMHVMGVFYPCLRKYKYNCGYVYDENGEEGE